ncbi:unnamed protein product [Owenia fusiformis]|uniref:Uncharacterized protein n=1 Tax=Owenia fusiformis TaxID=6347 RepID=A0A8J1TW75_OWEFU|nr:unnamed protein product [Owenia fusiformis]
MMWLKFLTLAVLIAVSVEAKGKGKWPGGKSLIKAGIWGSIWGDSSEEDFDDNFHKALIAELRKLSKTIDNQGSQIRAQGGKLTAAENKIKSQENNIKDLDNKRKDQDNKIKNQDNKIKSQDNQIRDLENKRKDQEKKISNQENKIRDQENKINGQQRNINSIENARRADSTKLSGVATKVTNLENGRVADARVVKGLGDRLTRAENKVKVFDAVLNDKSLENRLNDLGDAAADAKTKIEKIVGEADIVKKGQAENREMITTIKEQIANLAGSPCDGECVDKKITESEKKLQDNLELYVTNAKFDEFETAQEKLNGQLEQGLATTAAQVDAINTNLNSLNTQQTETKGRVDTLVQSTNTFRDRLQIVEDDLKINDIKTKETAEFLIVLTTKTNKRLVALENVTDVNKATTTERIDSVIAETDSRLNNIVNQLESAVARQQQVNFVDELRINSTDAKLRDVITKVDELQVGLESLANSHVDLGNLSVTIVKAIEGFEKDATEVSNIIETNSDELQKRLQRLDNEVDSVKGVMTQFADWTKVAVEDINTIKSDASQMREKISTNTDDIEALDTVVPRIEQLEKVTLNNTQDIRALEYLSPKIAENGQSIKNIDDELEKLKDIPSNVGENTDKIADIEGRIADLPEVKKTIAGNQDAIKNASSVISKSKSDIAEAQQDINDNKVAITEAINGVDAVRNNVVAVDDKVSSLAEKVEKNKEDISELNVRLGPLGSLPLRVGKLEDDIKSVESNVVGIQGQLPKIDANAKMINDLETTTTEKFANVRNATMENVNKISNIATKLLEIDTNKKLIEQLENQTEAQVDQLAKLTNTLKEQIQDLSAVANNNNVKTNENAAYLDTLSTGVDKRFTALENVTETNKANSNERIDSVIAETDSRLNNVIRQLESAVARQDQVNFIEELHHNATDAKLRDVTSKVEELQVGLEALANSHIDLGNLSVTIVKAIEGFEKDASEVSNIIETNSDELQKRLTKLDNQVDTIQGVMTQFADWTKVAVEDINTIKSDASQMREKISTNTDDIEALDTVVPRIEQLEKVTLNNTQDIRALESLSPKIAENVQSIKDIDDELEKLKDIPNNVGENTGKIADIEGRIADLPEVKKTIAGNQDAIKNASSVISKSEADIAEAQQKINNNKVAISEAVSSVDVVRNSVVAVDDKVDSLAEKVKKNEEDISGLTTRVGSLENLPARVNQLETGMTTAESSIRDIQNQLPKITANTQKIDQLEVTMNEKLEKVQTTASNNTNKIADVSLKQLEIDEIRDALAYNNRKIDTMNAHIAAICQRTDLAFDEMSRNWTSTLRPIRNRLTEVEKIASAPQPDPWVPSDGDKTSIGQVAKAITDLQQVDVEIKSDVEKIKADLIQYEETDMAAEKSVDNKLKDLQQTHKTDKEAGDAKIDSTITTHNNDMTTFQQVKEEIRSVVQKNAGSIEKLEQGLQKLENSTAKNALNIAELEKVKAEQAIKLDAHARGLTSLIAEMDAVIDTITSQNATIKSVQQELSQLKQLTVGKAEIADIVKQIERISTASINEQKKAITDIQSEIETIKEDATAQENALGELRQKLASATSGMNITIEELKRELENLWKTGDNLGAEQRNFVKEVRDIMNAFSNSMSKMDKGLKDLNMKVDNTPDKADLQAFYTNMNRGVTSTRQSIVKQQQDIMALFGQVTRITGSLNSINEDIQNKLDTVASKTTAEELQKQVADNKAELNQKIAILEQSVAEVMKKQERYN